jgi:lipopolysaccharide biosynthesis glycosyltransferase
VVYQDDIAKVFDAFPIDDENLVAGVWDIGYAAYHRNGLFPIGRPLIRKYARLYTSKELNALKIGAGLLVYNMKALRDGGWTAKWHAFARENAYRAILPEQEVINLTLGDKIHILPLNFMAIAEHAIIYDGMSVAEKNKNLSWEEMYKAPIQMHYASKVKPWKYPGSSRSELWFEACVRAQMTSIWRKWYAEFSKSMVEKEFAKRIFELNMGRFNLNLIKKRKRSHV